MSDDERFDEVSALVLRVHAYVMAPYVGQEVLVRVDDPVRGPSLLPVASQVVRIAAAGAVADGAGTMVAFCEPIEVPHSPHGYQYTVCDLHGKRIE